MNRRFQILVLHDCQTNHKSLSQCSHWSVLFYLTLMYHLLTFVLSSLITEMHKINCHFLVYRWNIYIINNIQSMDISIRHLRFFTIYFIWNHIFFKRNILKLSLGRFLWNLFQDTQNYLNFIYLSDSNFCLHGFYFLVI